MVESFAATDWFNVSEVVQAAKWKDTKVSGGTTCIE
jgi:hypothetical protein